MSRYFFCQETTLDELILRSECECNRNELIRLRKIRIEIGSKRNELYRVYLNERFSYSIEAKDFESLRLTCNLYDVFRRGPRTNIIGLSLYGNKSIYTRNLPFDLLKVKREHPQWTFRIYHDSNLTNEFKCKLKCMRNHGQLVDNVDFCDINSMPSEKIDLKRPNASWSANYLHAMKWRWVKKNRISSIILQF